MALLTHEQASAMGVGYFGDPKAPIVDRVIATFTKGYVPVTNERVTEVAPEIARPLGSVAVIPEISPA